MIGWAIIKMGKNRRNLSWFDNSSFMSFPFKQYLNLLPEFNFNYLEQSAKNENISLIKSRSSLCKEIIENKGGWLFPEKVYVENPTYLTRANEHNDELDKYILNQKMCHSLRTRFDYVSQELLPSEINKQLKNKDFVRIASFGSGTGRDVLYALKYFGKNVVADLYDLDSLALSEGRKISEAENLQDRVRFIHQDLNTIQNGVYDIGLMIGIVCPLPDLIARRVLRNARKYISGEGILLVSSSSDKMEFEDPLSRFLIEYGANWFLQFRNDVRMKNLMESSGYKDVRIEHEPLNHHKIAIGR